RQSWLIGEDLTHRGGLIPTSTLVQVKCGARLRSRRCDRRIRRLDDRSSRGNGLAADRSCTRKGFRWGENRAEVLRDWKDGVAPGKRGDRLTESARPASRRPKIHHAIAGQKINGLTRILHEEWRRLNDDF